MKNILIDTCVIIHIIRQSTSGKNCLDVIKNYDENPNFLEEQYKNYFTLDEAIKNNLL